MRRPHKNRLADDFFVAVAPGDGVGELKDGERLLVEIARNFDVAVPAAEGLIARDGIGQTVGGGLREEGGLSGGYFGGRRGAYPFAGAGEGVEKDAVRLG